MNVYEFIGIIIGDGNILYNKEKRYYRLEITGNAMDDPLYFEKISNFIQKEFGITPKIKIRYFKNGKCIKLYIDNKKFVEHLINNLGLPYGRKTFTIKIPKKYLGWNYSKYIIRGIFETDGCIYFSKSRTTTYLPTYPRLEIRSSSEDLVKQLKEILFSRGFKVQVLKPKKEKTYKIYLSGSEMLKKWIKEIGFGNIKNLTKYLYWKRYKYYKPKISLKERFNQLNIWADGEVVNATDVLKDS